LKNVKAPYLRPLYDAVTKRDGNNRMKCQMSDDQQARSLRDLAVLAVARRGALERSGAANLAVLKQDDLMIGYHTPFNPLPKLSDNAKYAAALGNKDCGREAYGVDIWLEAEGKVFSAGWAPGGDMNVRLFKPGPWQSRLEEIVAASPVIRKVAAPRVAKSERLRVLEQENKQLRRTISGLMLDKLILAQAAAGKL
jgi:hypothetical protein